jgi:predicted DCC family thiol-disulfide oxidoreductase YuxK
MEHQRIVLFDGVCNFCNGTVQFVIKNDPAKRFKFAALQSETGQALLQKHGFSLSDFDTFVLVDGDRAYTKSGAALRMARGLKMPWPLLYGFIIVPAFIRDAAYSLVARNRYKWFGKKDACMIPDQAQRDRFI